MPAVAKNLDQIPLDEAPYVEEASIDKDFGIKR